MIKEFQKEYRWLSNFTFFEAPLVYQEMKFPTNEHFYVAMKTKDVEVRKQVSEHPLKGVKKFGQTLTVREDWKGIRLGVMLYGLRYKFSENNPILRQKLIDTGDQELQEGNYWNDKFWGVCLKTGEGENNLGSLLMQVRDEITQTK